MRAKKVSKRDVPFPQNMKPTPPGNRCRGKRMFVCEDPEKGFIEYSKYEIALNAWKMVERRRLKAESSVQ